MRSGRLPLKPRRYIRSASGALAIDWRRMLRSDALIFSDGTGCAAWVYRPDGDHVHPMVVMAHGFSATREQRLDAYAERFCAAGIGVLLFDYRHFGASGGEPRQLLDIGRQHADFRAAVSHAARGRLG